MVLCSTYYSLLLLYSLLLQLAIVPLLWQLRLIIYNLSRTSIETHTTNHLVHTVQLGRMILKH